MVCRVWISRIGSGAFWGSLGLAETIHCSMCLATGEARHTHPIPWIVISGVLGGTSPVGGLKPKTCPKQGWSDSRRAVVHFCLGLGPPYATFTERTPVGSSAGAYPDGACRQLIVSSRQTRSSNHGRIDHVAQDTRWRRARVGPVPLGRAGWRSPSMMWRRRRCLLRRRWRGLWWPESPRRRQQLRSVQLGTWSHKQVTT